MRKRALAIVICAFSLLYPAQLLAGGNSEIGLPKVDRLIKERNYNAAILELANYMTEHPEDFDGAQRRLRRIIGMRDIYNAKALELLQVLSTEPTNDEKKLQMITYMEGLEKDPNAATRAFITETKATAQFTYYRAKFDEIMLSGSALIDSARYVEAVRRYEEGYAFYKDEFDAENDAVLVEEVNSRLQALRAVAESYSALQTSFPAAVSGYEVALESQDAARAESAYAILAPELTRFAALRNQAAESGWYFQDSFAAIAAKNDLVTENSFLPFAYRFTLGRKASSRFEGVLGAFDSQWNESMDRLERATEGAILARWTAGFDAFETGSTETASAHLDAAKRIASLGKSLAASQSTVAVRDDTWGRRDYRTLASRMESLGGLIASALALGERYARYQAVSLELKSTVAVAPSAEAVRKAPHPFVVASSARIRELDGLATEIAGISGALGAAGAIPGYSDTISSWSAGFARDVQSDIVALYGASIRFEDESASIVVAERDSAYRAALSLLEGVRRAGSNSMDYYPAESIVAFNAVRSGAESDRKSVLSLVSSAEKVSVSIRSTPAFSASLATLSASVKALENLGSDAASGIARANARVLQANLAKQESDLRYSQAQAALKKNDFQGARDNLQRAREKVNLSLSYQASESFRASSDLKIENLGAEITRVENEAVVREVRALISSGKKLYYLGNFDQAEQVFGQAKTRWSVTNIEANAEITNWLDIINTALSMKTGRTIPVSAPLYPQMSQILNTANQLYNEGKSLMAFGKRDTAIATLSEAKKKLQQLQLVYPLNQDAGQLTLKIDQLIDPVAFKTFFSQKVEYVRANYKTEKQTSYSDLLDLYQINPSYPGIKKLVDEVEIYLGIQIPPPDPKALARSAELTRAAQKIYDANTRSMFQVALDQLEEAIKLNPDNQAALALKDRVQTASGGQSVAVLSAEDEAKYQSAVQELQKGNKITASALVEQLLLNPKSQNSAKIQDLKKRIDSQL